MAEKKFLFIENQKAWDSYYGNAMKNFTEEKSEEFNKKKISVLQYKPVILAFELYVKKPFNNITEVDIENFAKDTDKKSKLTNLNAFLVTSITSGNIKVSDSKLLISLLPEAYRKLGRMIANN